MRLSIVVLLFSILFGIQLNTEAQISAPNATGQFPTNYSAGLANDTIYYFCSPGPPNIGELVASGPNPSSTYNFIWQKFNPALQQFVTFNVGINVPTSTQPNLLSGGYKVIIQDNLGNLVGCHVAWVYVVDINLNLNALGTGCAPNNPVQANYSGPALTKFEYYNPPPDPVYIDSNTIFEICVKGNIPYISDMGIVLEAPATCGGTRVTVVPFAAASDLSISAFCNPGSGVDACFRSDLPVNFDVCAQPIAALTGTFGFGPPDPFNGYNYPVNDIYALNGCNAAQPNWEMIFLDFAPPDNPTVQEVSLKIINPGFVTCDGQGDTIVHEITGANIPIAEGAPNGGHNPNTATKITLNYTNNVPSTPIVYDYDALLTLHQSSNPSSIQWTTNNGVTFVNPNVLNPTPSAPITQDTWFYFTMTDHLGCTFSDSVFFDYITPQIDSVAVQEIKCFGDGDASITIHNLWASQYSIDLGTTWQNSNVFSNLGPGIYSIILEDSSGTCIDTVSRTITQPDTLIAQVSPNDANCHNVCDGSAVAGVSGGTGPYTYNWPSGSSTTNFTVGLCPDSFLLVVIDSNGCTANDSFLVSAPSPFSFVLVIDTTSCSVDDGQACITNLSGASPPYGYVWDQNSGGGNDSCATALAEGLYSVTVFDDRGCDTAFIVDIPIFPKPTASLNLGDSTLCTGSALSISSSGSGGTPSYNFVWNNGWTGGGPHALFVTDSTCVTVKIQDSKGCESQLETACFNIFPPIKGMITGGPQVCENGTVDLLASGTGGMGPTYSYLWSDNLGNNDQVTVGPDSAYPSSTTYFVVISDGCAPNDTVYAEISVLQPPEALFELADSLDCYPQDVELVDKSDNSLTGIWDLGNITIPYTPGETISHYFQSPGSYEVSLVTSSPEACLDTFELEICVKESDRFFIPDIFSPNGNGFNDVFRIYAKNYSTAKLLIYDRWGEKVFESLTLETGWDGKFRGLDMPSGIYLYFLDIAFDDGQTLSEQGDFTLIR
ncbi:MAG: gliding motility-associated C-terminal domain-containing protein [Flavobacteriales bacterium]|nr:gliding motility-associated C-terminal domain-containing protein [Flavobacteriales bacterium]